MSDITMSPITVRDLHRRTAAILEACEREGEVRIRHRDGREFRLLPVPPQCTAQPEWPDFKVRRSRIRRDPVPSEVCAKVDAAIRGE